MNSSKERVEFINDLSHAVSIPFAAPIEVKVGGATVFIFEVDSYDEF